MSRILLLEGPDCAGKSTLLKSLSCSQYTSTQHFGPFPHMHKAFYAYMNLLSAFKCLPSSTNNLIIDRMHLSSIAYNNYTKKQDYDITKYIKVDDTCVEMGVTLIVCLPSWSTVRRLWRKNMENELIQNEDDMRCIYEWFKPENIENYTKLVPFYYNWEI